MKAGDLIMWKWKGKLHPEMKGIIVSDYTLSTSKDGSILKNVYWFKHQYIRAIEQQYLEVISESR